MADPISSFSGLASGIQWRDMVDQIMSIESARQLVPLRNEVSASQKRIDAWNGYAAIVAKLNTAAAALRDGTPFGAAKATVGNSPTTSRALLTATAGSGAATGSYRVKVEALAKAERLGGLTATDPNAALGLAGELRVNGRAVTIAATDTLYSVRDKLNAVNAGTQASRVTATVLTSLGRSQLVLTSDVTGEAGIDLDEVRAAAPAAGETTLLAALGLEDAGAGATLRVGDDGAVRSSRFSSATTALLASLGVATSPPPARLVVNGREIVVDPATVSLTELVSLVNAQSPGTASIETTTEGGATWHRLKLAGTVAAGDADSAHLMRAMGLTVGTRATSVTQSVRTGSSLALAADASTATAATSLDALALTTGAGAIAAGDAFVVSGTTGDGQAVPAFTISVTDAAAQTLGDVAAQIEAGFAARGRAVSVTVDDGRFVVSDTASGSSQLAFAISAVVAGGTLDLGATTTDPGRARQLVAGQDARIVVDGTEVRRSTNTVTDAIGGVTLALQQAEPGTEIAVEVARDDERVVQAVQDYAKAYNDVVAYVERSTAAGGALAYNGSLRASLASLRNVLLTPVTGLPDGAAYARGALVGVALSKTGQLEVDATALRAALTTDLGGVRALFGTAGVSANAQLQYVSADAVTRAGRYTVDVTRPASVATALGGAAFTYAGAAGDRMTVRDDSTGREITIDLENGDTPTSVAARLEASFGADRLRLAATVEGGTLRLSSLDAGSAIAFTVSYASTAGTDVAGQVGIAAGQVKNGLDVEGTFTIDGVTTAGTGAGRLLTGADGSAAEGLALRYLGDAATTSPVTVDFSHGIGGLLARIGEQVTRSGDGLVANNTASIQRSMDLTTTRADDVEARLERRRDALIRQFTAMEAALSRIQAQGNWLASQVKALQPSSE